MRPLLRLEDEPKSSAILEPLFIAEALTGEILWACPVSSSKMTDQVIASVPWK
jgi:hypothetical protein